MPRLLGQWIRFVVAQHVGCCRGSWDAEVLRQSDVEGFRSYCHSGTVAAGGCGCGIGLHSGQEEDGKIDQMTVAVDECVSRFQRSCVDLNLDGAGHFFHHCVSKHDGQTHESLI